MSDLIQITTPSAPREYGNQNMGNRNQPSIQQNATGQVFDLGNQTEIVKTNDRSGDSAQQNLKDDSGALLMRTLSDSINTPTTVLNTAKELISKEVIALIRESGDTETLNKVTEFASEVMLSPENLTADMVMQQSNATVFGDKLWGVLKSLIDITGSKDFEAAAADFAKAACDVAAKPEILKSLAANFRFLAAEAAPGKAVADELLAASKALSGADAARNFAALKPTLLKLLGYTEHSLLLNDNTKNLLPLVIHNISRYNDNPDALKGSFDSLIKLAENIDLTPEQSAAMGLDSEMSLSECLTKLFDSYIMKNEKLSPEIKQSIFLNPDSAHHESELQSAVNLLAAGAKHMASRIPSDEFTRIMSSVDFSQGAEALRKVIGSVIPNTPEMRTALQSLFNELEQTGDLNRMVDQLNTILENIDESDSETVIKLAQGLNSALDEMVQSGKYTVSNSTSMETLTDFLTKNINSSILQSMSGVEKGEMVQNLLTAPGVFTPLLHHFVPLDAFGKRSFGELWIDPNADELVDNVKNNRKGSGSGAGSHMFLCFDIEDIGYFELEIYEKDKNMSVMLLCPEKLESVYMPIREVIPKIAAENGYKVTASIVEGVMAKRRLDQVFPKLSEPKNSLNVKI